MPPLHLFIKPASGNCNLYCSYCFYKDITKHRKQESYGIMAKDTMQKRNVLFPSRAGSQPLLDQAFTAVFFPYVKNIIKTKLNSILQYRQMVFPLQKNGQLFQQSIISLLAFPQTAQSIPIIYSAAHPITILPLQRLCAQSACFVSTMLILISLLSLIKKPPLLLIKYMPSIKRTTLNTYSLSLAQTH